MTKPLVLAVCNQKGGVGKTSVAAATAQFWSRDLDVLLLDVDPQASASGIFLAEIGTTSFDVLTGAAPVDKAIVPVLSQYPPRLKVLPAGLRLAELDAMLVNLDRFHCVQDLVDKIGSFDAIVIDCPGTMSLLTVAPLVAADFALIPTSAEPMAFDQVEAMKNTIATVRRRLNPGLHLLPLAVTLYDGRARLDAEVLSELRVRHDVFKAVVRRHVRIKEEFATRQPCTNEDLKNLANEILERIRHEEKAIQTDRDQERIRPPPGQRPRP